MSNKAQQEIIRYRGQKPWTLEIPVHIPDRERAVRSATREPDQVPLISKDDRNWAMLYAGLGILAVVLFIAAFEYGLFDFFISTFP